MEDMKKNQESTHIILAGEPSRVDHAFRISQMYGSIKKIILVVPEGTSRGFEKIRNETSKYFKEIVIREVTITDIAQSALQIYEIIREEKKSGKKVIINITDSSVAAFAISGCLTGSVTKSKVITSDLNDETREVPLVPYCRLVQSRYEILCALGDKGAEDTKSLKTELVKINQNWKGVQESNMSTQLKMLEERGFIVREKNRQAKRIERTTFGLLIQNAYKDDPGKLKEARKNYPVKQ